MRKLFTIGILALSLAACQTSNIGSTGTTAVVISQAQNYAQTACGFLPTVETVAGILNVNSPGLTTAQAIANAICNAVGTGKASVSRSAAPKTVAGVPVRGSFTRQ